MRAPVVLAATQHDPADAMLLQAQRVLSCLNSLYEDIVLLTTPTTGRCTIDALREIGIYVEVETSSEQLSIRPA